MNPITALLGYAKEAYQNAAPLHYRTFAETLLGRRDTIDESTMSAAERKKLLDILANSGAVMYGVDRTERPDGSVHYPHVTTYGALNGDDISSTFGKGGLRIQPDGSGLFADNYDFNNDAADVEEASKMYGIPFTRPSRLSAIAQLIGSALKGDPDPGDMLPDVALNGASRPVRVKLTKEEMKRIRAQDAENKLNLTLGWPIHSKKPYKAGQSTHNLGGVSSMLLEDD